MSEPAHRLRLILGDQLNPEHSWFAAVDATCVYVLMEVRQETDYVLHHAQKVIAIFAAMRRFADNLRSAGHRVHYLHIGGADNRQSLVGNIDALITRYGARCFDYQMPDEWRLDRQLADYAASLPIETHCADSEHFYTSRGEASTHFGTAASWLMESFYRHLRTQHRVLLDEHVRPIGGRWNFDTENRKAWHSVPAEPQDERPAHDHTGVWREIQEAGTTTFGNPSASTLRWPIDRAEALSMLDRFINGSLPHFGDYQDAMDDRAPRLFHSQLSFALNTKMLNPREVVARAERALAQGLAPLAAVEGFIRQILGWREFVRGVYWSSMPGYERSNVFGHSRELPPVFWNGVSNMRCMAVSVGASLDHAYAHHIQRLMIIGNFALLAGLDPYAVHQWYLGVYVDAFEWVEAPNTLGLSQYADGGKVATKPYAASAAYINRMSNYCSGCYYQRNKRTGPRACPFNALYWDFFARNRNYFGDNRRLTFVYQTLDRMDASTIQAIREEADRSRKRIDSL
jgi:deoxyribodipyrimidine photolyase-related protein